AAPLLRRRTGAAGDALRVDRGLRAHRYRAHTTSAAGANLRLQGGHQGGTAPVADGDERTLRQALRDRTALPRHPRPPHDRTASAGRDPQPLPPVSGEAPPVALAIVGPTASGKTTLSIEVARRLDGEIVSMDSRQ